MRISTASKFITVAVFGLSVINITTNMLAEEALTQRLLAGTTLVDAISAVSNFAMADAKLTAAIRAYASTGEEHYKKEYDTELNVTQTIEHSIATLHESGVSSEEAELIDKAKAASDALIDPEARAFTAVAKGDLKEAVALVYGPKYLEVKQTMASLIEEARSKIQTRLTQRKVELSERAEVLSSVALIAQLINAIAMLSALMFFFQRKVVAPMNLLTDKTQKLIAGDNEVRFGHEDDTTELGDLAHALERYRLAGESIEQQRKVNQALAEVGQAVQSATSYAEFGDILCSLLAQIMGLAYGALFVADTQKAQLKRVGGYGCDDSIHANHFAWGQGLVGQVALSKSQILLSPSEGDRVGVSMGLGKLLLRNVLIAPILDRGNVLGVLELGTLQAFDSNQLLFLENLLPDIAEKIQILAGNVATRELLDQTRIQAEALAVSEQQLLSRRAELEENNNKLAEQARSLEESAEELEQQKSSLLEQREELEASKEVLTQIEERSRLILSAVSDGIVGMDTEGKITFCNPAVPAMLGYLEEELIGQPMHALVHYSYPDGREFPRAECSMYLTSCDGQPRKVDSEVLWRKDGTALSIAYVATAIYQGGRITGSVIVFRDITEQKQTEEERLHAISLPNVAKRR